MAISYTYYILNIYYRFPLNNPVLQHWEHFVQKANALKAPWKATSYSRICSKHFQTDDYILPPSSGTTCRLKQCAKPSILDKITPPVTIPDALQQSQLENQNKRPLQAESENSSPLEKIAKTAGDQRIGKNPWTKNT